MLVVAKTVYDLIPAAEKAGMRIPPIVEIDGITLMEVGVTAEEKIRFIKFLVFQTTQIEMPMPYPDAHFKNAARIASVNDDSLAELLSMCESVQTLIDVLGLEHGYANN